MLDQDVGLNSRFAATRPGLELMAIDNAALPVTVVQTDVLAQERKALPLLNEFVLRFCQAGLVTVKDIADTCGLEAALVETAVADEVSSGDLVYAASRGTLALTAQGRRTCHDLEAVQPVQKTLPITFDRLTWAIADYARRDLVTKKEARERDMILLPAARTARIGPDDLTVPALNSLLRGRGAQASRIEILSVRKLRPNIHRYLPVKLLIYGDVNSQEVELSVVVDDEQSSPHDISLAGLGGAEHLGVKIAAPDARPTLSSDLEAQRLEVGTVDPSISLGTGPDESPANIDIVRGVGVFEHRQLLDQALGTSTTRLLLISPWVKAAVVDTSFLGRLEGRLRAGCTVHIAHGYGDDDGGSDSRALERLGNLQQRFKDRFTFARLANTHAKILIFDDTWISTSFNWLSFRGDPDRTYRMEEGTLVRIPERVATEYQRYVGLIEQQRLG